MKKIIFLFLLILITDLNSKEWVEKHIVLIGNSVPESIYTLQCVDSSHCYAFADYVYWDKQYTRIYKTVNQGDTWSKIYEFDYTDLGYVQSLSRCFAVDTNHLFITYRNSLYRVNKSSDGGKTFKTINFVSPDFELRGGIDKIVMYDRNIGIIVTDNALIYTSNGWDTYEIYNLDDISIREYSTFFINSSSVCLVQRIDYIGHYYSFDFKTEKWKMYAPPNYAPGSTNEIIMYDVCFIDDSVGFGCGGQDYGQGSYASDVIWKTTDRGKKWEIIYNDTLEKTYPTTKISFSDEKNGMAVGNWGKYLQTTDGGETWFYHSELPIRLKQTTTVRVAMAGEYPLVTSSSGGIYRYEDDVSLNETEFQDAIFSIHQTPENFTINITDARHRKYSLQIADMSGKTVYEGSLLYSLENVVSLSGFASGVYVYRIMCGGAHARSGKIVITR